MATRNNVKINWANFVIPDELALGNELTYEQWRAGRRLRRELSDRVSPEECGKDTSEDGALLRAKYMGRRNSPFTPTRDLPGVSLYDVARQMEATENDGVSDEQP